jgi:hypothetical protein
MLLVVVPAGDSSHSQLVAAAAACYLLEPPAQLQVRPAHIGDIQCREPTPPCRPVLI